MGRGREALAVGLTAAALLSSSVPGFAQEAGSEAAVEVPQVAAAVLTFPVAGDHSFSDTFGAPRPGGRLHMGIDVFAEKLTPVVAVADGIVVRVAHGGNAGHYIVVRHADGSRSYYLHLNNDTPGTDDGAGWQAVESVFEGATVAAGDVLNYVGDSGNAEGTPPHLHFELHGPDGTALNPFSFLQAAATGTAVSLTAGLEAPAEVAGRTIDPYAGAQFLNTGVVGHVDLGGGFNADVALHADHVYLGSWGRPGACPGHGVRVLDVTHPQTPTLIGSFATADEFPGTYTENAWVGSVETASFASEVAVVAVRLCDNTERGRWQDGLRGIALYDVSDPAAPRLLSTLDTGPRTQGVHEMAVARLADGSIRIAVTVMQSYLHHPEGAGDLRIIDMTAEGALVEVADWDLRRDGPPDLVAELMATRGDEELHAHGVWLSEGGARAYVSHWDGGTVVLDLAAPESPQLVELTQFSEEEEGNGHSVSMVDGGSVMVQNSEDLYPFDEEGEHDHDDHVLGWGYQRIYQDMEMVSTFATENSIPGDDGEVGTDGFYTVHNADVIDSISYASWYSDGLRIVDISDPAVPTEVGYFVPPPAPDPQGYWMAPDGNTSFPMVWGVYIAKDLIYLSDINSGLWVVRFDDPNGVEAGHDPAAADEGLLQPRSLPVDATPPEAAATPAEDGATPPEDDTTPPDEDATRPEDEATVEEVGARPAIATL